MRRWIMPLAIVVAAVILILAPTRPKLGQRGWQDPMWDIYDEIASGPAD